MRVISGLYVIVDSKLVGERDILGVVKQVILGGARIIQLRDKEGSTRKLIEVGLKIRRITKKRAIFIVNDRLDVAMAVDADGLHLGQEDMPLTLARKLWKKSKIIGVSVENLPLAKRAEREGADYVGVGSIFKTSTKIDAGYPLGTSIISKIKKRVKIPVVAIGGVDEDNLEEVAKAGADAIAVARAVIGAEDIRSATARLSRKWKMVRR